MSQQILTTVGVSYIVAFRTQFNYCVRTNGDTEYHTGFVGVCIDDYCPYDVDACDHGEENNGKFMDNVFSFVPTREKTNVRFEFIAVDPKASMRVDNIVVGPGS